MVEPPSSHVAYEEYLAAEQNSDTKHEWLDGVVYAMVGGTLEHSRLAQNMGAVSTTALSGCDVFQSHAMTFVRATQLSTYADVAVVCGPVESQKIERNGRKDTRGRRKWRVAHQHPPSLGRRGVDQRALGVVDEPGLIDAGLRRRNRGSMIDRAGLRRSGRGTARSGRCTSLDAVRGRPESWRTGLVPHGELVDERALARRENVTML